MILPLIFGLSMMQQPLFVHSKQAASGCTTGSFYDTFAGSTGTLLATHNATYVSVDGTYPVGNEKLSGSNTVQSSSAFANGGALVSCSSSDTFQIDIVGAPTIGAGTNKYVTVRGTMGIHRGYAIAFCYNSAGNWDSLCIFKDGTLVQQGPHTGYDPTQTYTLKVIASGSSSTLITGYVNGTPVVTYTDTTSPILSGNPGWYSDGDGIVADSQFTNAYDYEPPTTPTRFVTTTGNDANPCTISQPCLTPTHAASIASPGDTVLVASGVYSYGGSAATFSTGGTAGNPITITCAVRGTCKITNSVTGNTTVVYLHAQYLVFDGFEVTNSGAGNNLGIFVDVSNISITRNLIHDIQTDCTSAGGGGIQIYTNNYTNILIDSNRVYNISWVSGAPKCDNTVVQTDGILAEQTGFTTTTSITNNIVYNVSGGWCVGTSTNAKIANNTLFNCVNGGVVVNNAPTGAIVQDNIITYTGILASNSAYYGGACAIQNGTSSTTSYGYNQLSNNHGGNYGTGFGCSGSGTTTGDITTDPASGTTFVNWQQNGSGDYHLKAAAPAINAATNLSITHDYDGNPRPVAGGYDMGAYEKQ